MRTSRRRSSRNSGIASTTIRLYGELRKQETDRESYCRHQQGTGGFETELRGNPRSAENGTEARRYEGGQHDGAGRNAA